MIPWYRTPSRTFGTIHSSADERPAMKRYLTDQSNTFTATRVLVKPAIGNPEMSLVKAYPALTYQRVVGFGAALTEDRVYCEMICDGIHLHHDIVRLIARCKGAGKAVAITDAMEAAGMPEGEYSLGGQRVIVKDGAARLKDGTLAGSVLTMPKALENLIRLFGIDPAEACAMCTSTPAARRRRSAHPVTAALRPGVRFR